MLRRALWCVIAITGICFGQLHSDFDEESRAWTLSNSVLEAKIGLGLAGTFEFRGIENRETRDSWRPADGGSSPIRLQVDERWIDEKSAFRLIRHWIESNVRGGLRQSILLDEVSGLGQILVEIEIYPNLPTLRYGVRYRNSTGKSVEVAEADPVRWRLLAQAPAFRAMRVEQWLPSLDANPADFERVTSTVDTSGGVLSVSSGAHARYCSWLALSDTAGRGLAFGWEFNGRMTVDTRHVAAENRLEFSGRIPELHHPVEPGDSFQVPRAFVSLFHGGPDEAGHATQRFVELALAKQARDSRFPYVSWDSWAYYQAIDEETLRRQAALAAQAGVELFIVDLGWARSIGDWHPDPVKFPRGMRSLSDYVHSLGMKFGLHFAWPHASLESPVLKQHPDWVASVNTLYYGASSLCLAHRPVRDWITSEAIRIIDDYGVDWILQDGENMVKDCRSKSHTHHPDDSNYANAVDGLDAILSEIQEARPHVLWENCENGGNLMTYQMVQQYVTSIVNDASGALGSRLAVYGATFPFPPRYSDRYMPEQKIDAYTARSYEFGGPWILMNKLDELDARSVAFLNREIERFKQIRSFIREAKVLHVSDAPALGRTDAIAAYDKVFDTGIAVVTRDGSDAATFQLRIGEFDPGKSYQVTFASGGQTFTLTGAQIAQTGITVQLPETRYSEVVYIAPIATATELFK